MIGSMTKAEWLEKRRDYIGGSDAAAAVGESPFVSPFQLWQDKMGLLPDQPSEAKERGLLLEPLVIRLYERRFGRELEPGPWVVSKDKPFIAATTDALDHEINSAVQGKTSTCWKRNAWGDDGTADIPWYIYLQAQHEMFTIGAHRNQVVCLFADSDVFRALIHMLKVGMKLDDVAAFVEERQQAEGSRTEFVHYPIARDEKTIESLIAAEEHFWCEHVVKQIPPADILAPEKSEDEIEANPDQRKHLAAMRSAHEAVKTSEEAYAEAKELVRVDIGDKSGIYDPDLGRVTNKTGKPKQVLKLDQMLAWYEAKHPAIYKLAVENARVIVDESKLLAELKIALPLIYDAKVEEFTVEERGARIMRPYWKKNKKPKAS